MAAIQAAIRAGWPRIPIDEQDFASPEDETAHLLADNKLPELADLDLSAVAGLVSGLEGKLDLDLTGFDAAGVEALLKQFDVGPANAPELDSGDRAPFQQMTFTLHDDQAEQVKAALEAAIEQGHGESAVNENSNGNALAAICSAYLRQHGKG